MGDLELQYLKIFNLTAVKLGDKQISKIVIDIGVMLKCMSWVKL